MTDSPDTPTPKRKRKETRHGCEIEQDNDGWWFASCLCGWQRGPFPDAEDAADSYGDHRAAQAVIVTANVIKKSTEGARRD